jgi:hypothetical protein
MLIRVWEVDDIAKPDHIDPRNIRNNAIFSDNETYPEHHVTHVTSTILATGILEPVKGTALKAAAFLFGINETETDFQ